MTPVLPDDLDALKALVLAERAAHAQTAQKLQLAELERDQVKYRLKMLLKRYFGRSSEKLDPAQLEMAWAAVEADRATNAPAPQAPPKPPQPRQPSLRRQRRLEDLPVETVVVDVPAEARFAPDGTALVKIREEVTEEVDYEPGKLFRRRIVRPIYASPAKDCPPVIAELPARVIPGGQVGPGLIAHVLMSKYVDAIPLYRQAVRRWASGSSTGPRC